MLFSVWWYLKLIVSLIGKTPQLIYSKRILKKQGQKAFDDYVYGVVTDWTQHRLKDSRAQITVHHAERIPKDRNVLFVSNHQSDFDIAVFLALIDKPMGFVAKIEMEKIPLLNTWMKNIQCVFMDRHDLKQSVKTILKGIEILKSGYSLTIFPEGTRSKSSHMGEFKAGSFKLATKSGVPIVPVTINGTYKIMEGSHYRITPATASVEIHDPIYLDGLSKKELTDLPQRVREVIVSGLRSV